MRWWIVAIPLALVCGCSDTPMPPATECTSVGAEGKACKLTPADPCMEGAKCQSGVCKGIPKKCDAPPSSVCKDNTTLTVYSTPGTCQSGQCEYPTAPVTCPLGCDSAAGTCKGDPCQGVTCPAGPQCLVAQCTNGTCSNIPDAKQDGTSCDDKDSCTENDACASGVCKGTAKVCNTPPKNSCKDATTLVVYSTQGACKSGQCDYSPSEQTCSGGCDSAKGQCKNDPCGGVTCTSPPSVCYRSPGTCNPATGQCSYDYDNGKSCDDKDPCSTTDVCSQGVCKGTVVTCTNPPADKCKDANTLTTYSKTGQCTNGTCAYMSVDVPCSFGCDSTTLGCKGDPCKPNPCTKPPNGYCYDPAGICSSVSGSPVCTYSVKPSSPCDDSNLCTYNDKCDTTGNCAGTTYTCNDNLTCTTDTCTGTGTCIFTPNAGACAVAGACYTTGQQNPSVTCQYCDPAKNPTGWSVSANYCAIGSTCYGPNATNPSATCMYCDPTKSQTTWTIGTGYCGIYGVCYAANATNPSRTCQYCDPGKSQTAWSLLANYCLIGSTCYANGSTYPGQTCMTCNTSKNTSAWTITTGNCAIGSVCYASGAVNATYACLSCQPTVTQTAWSPTAGNCYIGACYANGAKHPSQACLYCDTAKSQSTWSVSANNCGIGGVCYAANTAHPSATCLLCDPAKSQAGWSTTANTCYIVSTCYTANAVNPLNVCEYCNAASSSAWSTATGTAQVSWNFDTGALQGWAVQANPANPTSPVKWQLDTKRAASPNYSLYFGNVTTHLFDDPGKSVAGAAVTPTVSLPTGQGKLCLDFKLWKFGEGGGTYDQLMIYALPTGQLIWKSGNETNNANVASATATGFLPFSANVTAFAGQTVQFKFYFDSLDSVANTFEGAYLDDVRVLTNCTP